MFLEIQEKNLLIEEHQFWLSDASPSVKNTCFLSFSLCSKMCTFFCWHDFSFFHNEIAYDYTDVLTLSNSFCSLLYNLVSGISWWCISALSKNDIAILGSFLGHDTWCFRVHLLFCLLIICLFINTSSYFYRKKWIKPITFSTLLWPFYWKGTMKSWPMHDNHEREVEAGLQVMQSQYEGRHPEKMRISSHQSWMDNPCEKSIL